MAKRNAAKLTAWTHSGMRMDINGPITGVAVHLVDSLTEKQRQHVACNTRLGVLSELASERNKQQTKGYDADHDDTHSAGIIAGGAACYARYAALKQAGYNEMEASFQPQLEWPFGDGLSPCTEREAMIKAAAMLIAAIEQHDRRAEADAQEAGSSHDD